MKKRKLTPLTIALGLALVGNAYAANIVDGTLINSSTSFDEDTVYIVAAGSTTVASNSTDVPVVITIAEGKTLTLENTFANTQSKVIDASSKSGMVFEGGNVILRRDDTGSDKATEQYFIRATDGQIIFGGPAPQIIGGVEFKNASTKMEGTIAQGIYVMGATSFTEGFDMTLNRSDAAITTPENTTGVHLKGGSLYTKSATIKMIAGAKDVAMRGIWVEAGGDFQAESVTLNLDANGNSFSGRTLSGLLVAGAAGKSGLTVTGDVNIRIKNNPDKNVVARGMELSSDRKYLFGGTSNIEISNVVNAYGVDTTRGAVTFDGDLNIQLSQINGSDYYGAVGINATGNKNNGTVADVTVKNADIRITDSKPLYDEKYVPVRAVHAQGDSKVMFTNSLSTNAGLKSVANATIDIQKGFVTSEPIALTAQADSSILVNSSKQGTVHFSGYTERTANYGTPNGTISMNIGSGAEGDDSYWNVTQASTLTSLSLAKNASLFFKVRDTDLDGTNALITVTGAAATAVELASGSSIALYGSGFDLEAGKTIQLIKSDKGIEKDGNALAAGDSLDDLKGDLTVIDIKSLIRATETGFSKDQYDLSMKTDELLIATLKEKAPAPTPDPDPDPDPDPNPDPKPNPDPVPEPDRPSGDKVNDQTNALMQSSIAAAATMFAADELLIDTTMKSRQGVRQTGPFAAARVGRYDLDVRGDLETNVISGLLGYAVNLQGSEIGAFVEMGHGTYDTKTTVTSPVGETKGDGKHNYVGFGVYGNYATPIDWLHVTGYVKGGWLRNEFSAPIAGVSVDFDRTSNYWGAHLGMYGEFQAAGKIKNRTFLNYFYDGRESESYEASGSSEVAGARFHFDALNVHRVQAGSLIEYQYSSTLRPYASVAYEYAFKANAEGSARDHIGTLAMNGTDLEGGTGILSLGWTYLNEANTFEFDCGVNGYAGVRKGVSAQLQAAWKF
ncbi:autotransporter outer membrane beta-barrel domain-containing protein [Sutterella wadsworthensis]|uniref:autotransporter outer membrane beta-barrel domain-containing protein n=1 Tax=Sutterella wadsworthensis TaxID=40545 RepID=UPI00266B7310|nr:autotransporter outer membrane beta-barrel domain-containing protein [Sutterella wadsworthensis]